MRTKKYIHNGDPKDPGSYVATFDKNGYCTSRIYGDNPKHPRSFVATYDDKNGYCTSWIWGDNREESEK